MIATINPYTNCLIEKFEPLTDGELEQKILTASAEQKEWNNTLITDRIKLFQNLSVLLREQKKSLAKLATLEMGKLLREAELEIEKSAACIDYYIKNCEQYLKDEEIEIDYGKAILVKEPIGVVLAVMPWNFPFWQVFRFAIPALLAGNVALLKHASNVPQCSLAIEKLFVGAGFPDGVFQSLLIEAADVGKVIQHEMVSAVTLTGSEKAGAEVASLAGLHIKKAVLELGGSDAFVVMPDADLKKTVTTAVKSRIINCGQSCIAAKRFIVHQSVTESFASEMMKQFSAFKNGDPLLDETTLSPMAKEELIFELERQISESVKLGAKILFGGKRIERAGCFFEPTILTNVNEKMPVFTEETFGPLAAIISFETVEEAINLANNSRYGLGGSVWTRNETEGLRIAKRIKSGSVYVNQLMKSDIRLPFGGTKKSGFGKELSKMGFMEWVNTKSVVIA